MRIRQFLSLCTLLLTIPLFAACDAELDHPSVAAAMPLDLPQSQTTLADHVQMYAELLCAHQEECGAGPEWSFDGCIEELRWSEAEVSAFYDLEERGEASYDAVQSEACIEAIVFHDCPGDTINGDSAQAFDLVECQSVIHYSM